MDDDDDDVSMDDDADVTTMYQWMSMPMQQRCIGG